MEQPLNEQRFEALLDRHGAASADWPDDERSAALRLLDDSPAARRMLREAEQLDGALDAILSRSAPAPLGLKTRILADAPPRDAWLDWFTVAVWRPAALACLPLVLGFTFGAVVADDTADLEDQLLVAFADAETLEALSLPEGDG